MELTILRGLYCPHKVDLKGTPKQIYNDWLAHLSPATRNRIALARLGFLSSILKTNSRNQQIGHVPHTLTVRSRVEG